VNLNNEVGSSLQIAVDAASAGTANLVVRYANADTVDRPMRISLNGTVVTDSCSFLPTGAWTAWRSQTVQVTLGAGENVIELTSITPSGGPNIDWVALDPESTEVPSQCLGDLGPDGDVDGLDLAGVIDVFEPTFDLGRFALEFGRTDCP
jgi:hypothetical protein